MSGTTPTSPYEGSSDAEPVEDHSQGQGRKVATRPTPITGAPSSKCKKGNIRKETLEEKFQELLLKLQPNLEFVHLFRAVFLDVRKENQSQSTVQIHVLQKRLPDLKEQEQRLIDALVHRREIKQAVFDEQHDRVQQEITLTQMHLNEVSQVELDVEAALNFTQQVLCNAAELWAAGVWIKSRSCEAYSSLKA